MDRVGTKDSSREEGELSDDCEIVNEEPPRTQPTKSNVIKQGNLKRYFEHLKQHRNDRPRSRRDARSIPSSKSRSFSNNRDRSNSSRGHDTPHSRSGFWDRTRAAGHSLRLRGISIARELPDKSFSKAVESNSKMPARPEPQPVSTGTAKPSLPLRAPPSPSSSIAESDYIDLLLEYKQIQKQLESLRNEEAFQVDELSREQQKCKEEVSVGAATNDSSATLVPTDSSKGKNGAGGGDDDEDLDVLELRLAALGSLAQKSSQKGLAQLQASQAVPVTAPVESMSPAPPTEAPAPVVELPEVNKTSPVEENEIATDPLGFDNDMSEQLPEPPRYKRAATSRRQGSRDERTPAQKRHQSSYSDSSHRRKRSRTAAKLRSPRRADRRSGDSAQRRSASEDRITAEEMRRREIHRILTLDDHEKQVERFVQMMGSEKVPRRERKTSQNVTEKLAQLDNYEEVEMDMDSNPSTPDPATDNYTDLALEVAGEYPEKAPVHFDTATNMEAGRIPFEYYNAAILPAARGMPAASMWPHEALMYPPPEASFPLLPRVSPPQPTYETFLPSFRESQIPPGIYDYEPPPPPPPLPPPLPDEKPPSPQPPSGDSDVESRGHAPPSGEAESDDEEANILRQKLLEDLIQRRQKQLDEKVHSRSASPASIVRNASTSDFAKVNVHDDMSPYVMEDQLPVHHPVVISLGVSSGSESEAEDVPPEAAKPGGPPLKGWLDQFIKAQRQTVEDKESSIVTPSETLKITLDNTHEDEISENVENMPMPMPVPTKKQQRAVLHGRMKQLHAQYKKTRLGVERHQLQIRSFQSGIAKRQIALSAAQHRAQKLREQLLAAERVEAATQQQVDHFHEQLQRVQSSMEEKQCRLSALQQQLQSTGKLLHGAKYTFNPNRASRENRSKSDISKEKNELKERERFIAEKIRQLKEAQASHTKNLPNTFQKNKPVRPKPLEKISFNQEADDEREVFMVTPHRKRSLVDLSPSTKPNLLFKSSKKPTVVENLTFQVALDRISSPLRSETSEDEESLVVSASPRARLNKDSLLPGHLVEVEDKLVISGSPRNKVKHNTQVASSSPNRVSSSRRRTATSQSNSIQVTVSTDGMDDLRGSASPKNTGSPVRRGKMIRSSTPDPVPDSRSVVIGGSSAVKEEEEKDGLNHLDSSIFKMPAGPQLDSIRKSLSLSKVPANARHPSQAIEYNCSWLKANPKMVKETLFENLPLVKPSDVDSTSVALKYSSLLLKFRAYRFQPYFRTQSKQSLLSNTFSHKLDPNKLLCRFDLTGTCNDDKCPWQHASDYELCSEDQLFDLASYWPPIANVPPKSSQTQAHKYITSFVSTFQIKNEPIGHYKQCLLLSSLVRSEAKLVSPHLMFTEARRYRPPQKEREVDITALREDASLVLPAKPELSDGRYDDNTLNDTDIRYWMLSYGEVQDMETAVMENPSDIQIWFKLASKRLNDPHSNRERCLDRALHTLSRALEANRTSTEIWLYYLGLYEQRKSPDIIELCRQALKFAPSYPLFWRYIDLLPSSSQKDAACEELKQWLCQSTDMLSDKDSHSLLEVTLFQVSLHVSCGRYRSALRVFETALRGTKDEPNSSAMLQHLTPQDLCLAWLAYIHLTECRFLPPSLFDPANSNPGKIASKAAFMLPCEGKSRIPMSALRKLFQEAIQAVSEREEIRQRLEREKKEALQRDALQAEMDQVDHEADGKEDGVEGGEEKNKQKESNESESTKSVADDKSDSELHVNSSDKTMDAIDVKPSDVDSTSSSSDADCVVPCTQMESDNCHTEELIPLNDKMEEESKATVTNQKAVEDIDIVGTTDMVSNQKVGEDIDIDGTTDMVSNQKVGEDINIDGTTDMVSNQKVGEDIDTVGTTDVMSHQKAGEDRDTDGATDVMSNQKEGENIDTDGTTDVISNQKEGEDMDAKSDVTDSGRESEADEGKSDLEQELLKCNEHDMESPETKGNEPGANMIDPSCDMQEHIISESSTAQCPRPDEILPELPAIAVAVPLYKNYVNMEYANENLLEAVSVCEEVLHIYPACVDIWLQLSMIQKSKSPEEAVQVLHLAVEANPQSACLYHALALAHLEEGDEDGALQHLEDSALSFFGSREDGGLPDPNFLYCHLLDIDYPLGFKCPRLVVSKHCVQEQLPYIWLNYCFLVELQGSAEESSEIFESALAMVRNTSHVHIIWKSYLQRQLQLLSQGSHAATADSMLQLFRRSLLTIPSRVLLPHGNGRTWIDYTPHCDIVNMFIESLPLTQAGKMYEIFLPLMPNNVILIQRCCELALKEGDRAKARGISAAGVLENPNCLTLWKLHLSLMHREASYGEVQRLYRRALHQLPFALNLWKDYLSFEMVKGSEAGAHKIIQRCQELELNIDDFLNSLHKPVAKKAVSAKGAMKR